VARSKEPQRIHFTMDKNAARLKCWYSVSRGMITVSDGSRTSTHRLGSMPADARAEFVILMEHNVIE